MPISFHFSEMKLTLSILLTVANPKTSPHPSPPLLTVDSLLITQQQEKEDIRPQKQLNQQHSNQFNQNRHNLRWHKSAPPPPLAEVLSDVLPPPASVREKPAELDDCASTATPLVSASATTATNFDRFLEHTTPLVVPQHFSKEMLSEYIYMRVAESILFAEKAIRVLRNPNPGFFVKDSLYYHKIPRQSHKNRGLSDHFSFQKNTQAVSNKLNVDAESSGDDLLSQYEADKIETMLQDLKEVLRVCY